MWSGSFYNRKFPFWPFFNCSENFFLFPPPLAFLCPVRPEYKTVWMKWKFFMKRKKKVFSVCPRRFESLFVGLLCLFSSLSFHFGHVARLGAGVGWERGGGEMAGTSFGKGRQVYRRFRIIFARVDVDFEWKKFPQISEKTSCIQITIFGSSFPETVFATSSRKLSSTPEQPETGSPHFDSPQSSTRGQDSCTSFIFSILWSLSHDDNKLFLPFFLTKSFPYSPNWMNRHSLNRFIFKLACCCCE